jgi:hypothetical protein
MLVTVSVEETRKQMALAMIRRGRPDVEIRAATGIDHRTLRKLFESLPNPPKGTRNGERR